MFMHFNAHRYQHMLTSMLNLERSMVNLYNRGLVSVSLVWLIPPQSSCLHVLSWMNQSCSTADRTHLKMQQWCLSMGLNKLSCIGAVWRQAGQWCSGGRSQSDSAVFFVSSLSIGLCEAGSLQTDDDWALQSRDFCRDQHPKMHTNTDVR